MCELIVSWNYIEKKISFGLCEIRSLEGFIRFFSRNIAMFQIALLQLKN